MFSSDGKVILTVEKELDPTVSLTFDYLYFAGDLALGIIESLTSVDLESYCGFVLNTMARRRIRWRLTTVRL